MRGEVFIGILCLSIFILISAFSLILGNASGIESEGELSISFEPGTPNLNIGQGKSINFLVNVSVPNETDVSDITYMWTLDSIPVDISNDEPNIISLYFTEIGKKTVKVIVKYGNLTKSYEWTVIIDDNSPEYFFIPENTTQTVKEGGVLRFQVKPLHPETFVVYEWILKDV